MTKLRELEELNIKTLESDPKGVELLDRRIKLNKYLGAAEHHQDESASAMGEANE